MSNSPRRNPFWILTVFFPRANSLLSLVPSNISSLYSKQRSSRSCSKPRNSGPLTEVDDLVFISSRFQLLHNPAQHLQQNTPCWVSSTCSGRQLRWGSDSLESEIVQHAAPTLNGDAIPLVDINQRPLQFVNPLAGIFSSRHWSSKIFITESGWNIVYLLYIFTHGVSCYKHETNYQSSKNWLHL